MSHASLTQDQHLFPTTSNAMRFKTSVRNIQTFTSMAISLKGEVIADNISRAHSFTLLPGKGSLGPSRRQSRPLHNHTRNRHASMGVRTLPTHPIQKDHIINISISQIPRNRLHLRRLHHPIRRPQEHNQPRTTPPTPPSRPQIRHQRLLGLHPPHQERRCASPLPNNHHKHHQQRTQRARLPERIRPRPVWRQCVSRGELGCEYGREG